MTLTVLLLLVAGGIAGIAVLLHMLGMSKPHIFEDEAEVKSVWLAEYPDTLVRDVLLSENRHFALISSSAGKGIVWPMGADGAARLLLGVEITDMPYGLELSLPDYTAPEIRLKLDPGEAKAWRRQIQEAP